MRKILNSKEIFSIWNVYKILCHANFIDFRRRAHFGYTLHTSFSSIRICSKSVLSVGSSLHIEQPSNPPTVYRWCMPVSHCTKLN
jgi:hypothetical protein